jgi:pilus assembly protein CpaB
MSLRTIASLAVAIFLGLIAVLLVRAVLATGKTNGPQAVAVGTPVVVAALPILRGASLSPAMLKTVNYPKDAVPVGAFSATKDLTGPTARVALRSFAVNEPILTAKLNGPGAKTALAGALSPGMRAVSVKSDEVTSVAGFALPGDRVDILLTHMVGAGQAQTSVTRVLAENVRVLGVDQSSDAESDKPVVGKAVTVEVTPDQAQALSLAQAVGTVSLSLRETTDKNPLIRKSMTLADFGGARPTQAHRARPALAPREQVTVTRGVAATDYAMAGH